MKVINSRNTWYLIFGLIFIIILVILFFNLLFKRTEEKIVGQDRESYLAQENKKSEGITYIKASPTPSPSPQATRKPFFTLFDEAPKPSPKVSPTPSPSPTPNIKEATVTATVVVADDKEQLTKGATKSGDLKLKTDEDGTIYLTTENEDGTDDGYSKKHEPNDIETIKIPEGFATDIGEFINRMLRMVLVISALLVFAQLIWGGLEWITSGGDKGKTESARNKITAAVIGLIIVASSFAILQLSLNFLGYQSINELMNLL
jgi:hypothetical protein